MLIPNVKERPCGIELRSIPEAKFESPFEEISGSTPVYAVNNHRLFACA